MPPCAFESGFMYLVKLVAIRPLSGDDYGSVEPGAIFETNNKKAEMLEGKGLAYRYRPARPRPAAKMMPPPENKMLVPAHNKAK